MSKQKNDEQLLGDRVEKTLKNVGADKAARAYQRVAKRDCGCNKRKKTLNRLHESYRERRRRIMQQREARRRQQR